MLSKKVLSLALSAVVASSVVLAGCGSAKTDAAKSDGGKNDAGKTDAAKTDASKLKPYELTWYMIGGEPKGLKDTLDEVNKYTKEKINASVNMKFFDWGDYNQKMQVIINSGEKYDMCFTCSWANDYKQNARKGAFMELNDLLDKYGKGIKEVLNPGFLEGAKVDGKIYAVPANKELPAQLVWRFNKKYLDKYNLDYKKVRNLEDLEPLLKVIKEKEPDVVGMVTKPFLPYDLLIEGLPIGMDLETKDFKFKNILETPEMKKTLETMRKYFKAGYLRQDAAQIKGNYQEEEKAGKWFVGTSHTQPYADVLWSKSLKYDVISTPVHDPYVFNWSTTGSMQGISVKSGDPERAMMFLNLVNTDKKLNNLINYGVEGKHYNKIQGKENYVKQTEEGEKNYGVAHFAVGNVMLNYLQEGDPADKWDAFKKFNDSSKKAPTLGFDFNTDPVKNEIAALKNVAEQFSEVLYTGSVEPSEYLPKAIEKYKAAGLDKVMAEGQKQFDAWKKKNAK